MKKQNFLIILTVIVFVVTTYVFFVDKSGSEVAVYTDDSWWQIQSIDTVKYSRDIAREKANDSSFDLIIDEQVGKIAQTGATHAAIGTPYDPEFIPFLQRWVVAARNKDLNVWFRGNMAGWEGWFGYSSITNQQHTQKIEQFIKSNSSLFEDGDVFDPCPECENGNWGDPRSVVDLRDYRNFLINEYSTCENAFDSIGKDVRVVYSMNGDVAALVMDKDTTHKLGGIVTIDHYVGDGNTLVSDVDELAQRSEGLILLGEFGAPIPDIHGDITEAQQSKWIDNALDKLSMDSNVLGVNYWTSFGSSTSLWKDNGIDKLAVSTIDKYFSPNSFEVTLKDELGRPITAVELKIRGRLFKTVHNGKGKVTYLSENDEITASKNGYKTTTMIVSDLQDNTGIILQKENEGVVFNIARRLYKFLRI